MRKGRSSKALPVAVVLVAAALCIYFFRPKSSQPFSPVEVPRNELVAKDGKIFSSGGTPFTGVMIEKAANGTLLSRSSMKNGELEGLSEGWHPNGQVQVRENFTNGVAHGLRIKWHANGAKASEANIVDGKIEGVFRRWHDNGKLAEEVQMRNGEPDGPSLAYYPSGFLKAKVHLQGGKVLTQTFWKDGETRQPESP